MTHYTFIERINTSDGRFPLVNVQFSKNHRPTPIEEATYYLRPSSGCKRTSIEIGFSLAAAYEPFARRGASCPSGEPRVAPIQ